MTRAETHLELEMAKAIYFQGYGRPVEECLRDGIFAREKQRDRFLSLARMSIDAFITVLHRPTQEMLDAGFHTYKCVGSDDVLTTVWRNMIAALARQQMKPVHTELEHTS